MTEAKLTREQMRALIDAAVERSVERFGELISSGAFDGMDPFDEADRAKMQQMIGVQHATREDVQRWAREGWLEAMLEG